MNEYVTTIKLTLSVHYILFIYGTSNGFEKWITNFKIIERKKINTIMQNCRYKYWW